MEVATSPTMPMFSKLVIEKEKGGMRPIEPNHEEKQRVTINSNGLVWFTAYGVDLTDAWKYKALRKLRYQISREQTKTVFGLAERLLDEMNGVIDPRICDGEVDFLTAYYGDGRKQKQLINEVDHTTMQQLYEEIRKAVPIGKLLLFDYDFYSE